MEFKVKGLKVELSKLKKDLILAMDKANATKEQAKVLSDDQRAEKQLTLEKDEQLQAARERVRTIAIKSVKAFQQIDDYNIVLFNWYYKGFKLLRRYLDKHPIDVDLENLDFEAVDKEMAVDKATQAAQATVVTP